MPRLNFIRFSSACVLIASLWIDVAARAEIVLPKIIGDHMVLQRGMAAPIWGQAAPGEKISVRADWRWWAMTTTAGTDGRWMVKIPTPTPGGPHTITIQGGSQKIVLHDVLIGEVWVCSGQSNMEMPVGDFGGGYSGVTNWQEELRHADYPDLRLFTVENAFAVSPRFDCQGKWSQCDSNTARAFSATAFFFGRELHEKLKVPVALVDADVGGTVCEAWTSADTLQHFPDFADGLKLVAGERDQTGQSVADKAAHMAEWTAQIEPAAGAVTNAAPDFDDSSWRVTQNLGPWTGDIQFFEGFIPFRKTFDLPSGWDHRDLTLELGPVDDMDFTYLNGVKIGQTVGEQTWSQPRVYHLPGSLLKTGANVLTVCVLNTGGPGGISGPVRLHPADDTNSISLDHDWRYQPGTLYSTLPKLILPPQVDYNTPSVLFNAMISPLIPFGIRGAIWYQGESNIGRAAQYRRLFPAMIADWRQHWGEGNFPFYYVQIAPFRYFNSGMAAELREAQFLSLKTPNTGMAVTMDSDSNNLHPHTKQAVGHRLALWALAKTYGRDLPVYSGPLYQTMKVEDDKIRLFFSGTGGGLTSGGQPLEHFVIAGTDGKFVPAHAEIDGATIVVSNDEVKHPAAVRYAWGDADESSFGNQEGLPAPSFRTDVPPVFEP